jgi:hypothetical protein
VRTAGAQAHHFEMHNVLNIGWKLKQTHFVCRGSFHGLLRLEDGRLYPITRDGNEDVFKSSWVTFTR